MSKHRSCGLQLAGRLVLGATLGICSAFLWASDGGAPAGGVPLDPVAAAVGPGPGAGGQINPCAGKENRAICRTFETSLHKTRAGKARYYDKEWGGFELLTEVPYEELSCQGCHKVNPLAPDPYEPGCYDCHADTNQDQDAFNDKVPDDRCLGCHGRQGAERSHPALAGVDVHVKAGMACMDCHHKEEMHGDGRTYTSLQEPGAMKVRCTQAGCHDEASLATVSDRALILYGTVITESV